MYVHGHFLAGFNFVSRSHRRLAWTQCKKLLFWFNSISLKAQVKQNNGNVYSSPKINCWSSILWTCFAMKRSANENREKPLAIIWWSFYEKDHCHSPVLTTPTFYCFQTNLKFVNVNCVSQLINSLSQLFTLRPRWFKVLQTILFWHQATPAEALIILDGAIVAFL